MIAAYLLGFVAVAAVVYVLYVLVRELLPAPVGKRRSDPWAVPFGAHGEGPRVYTAPPAPPANLPSEVGKALDPAA